MQNDLVTLVQRKFQMLSPSMNERLLRLWSGAEAKLIGWGGITIVSQATGIAHISLISGTTTKVGLIVKTHLDTNQYETGIKVSDADMARLKICQHKFHGEWNYTIKPNHRRI